MTRIVRHQGSKFRSAPLSKHVAYLKREGVTPDGADARMFDARSDDADTRALAERCEDDRHHFRFTVSPEDAAEMADLRAFTRELMADAERDLGTKLDWVAVDHWNTDNPHIHVLVRGRADDGADLVIGFFQPADRPANQHDMRALFGERNGGRRTQAPGCTGNEGHLPRKRFGHARLSNISVSSGCVARWSRSVREIG